MKKIWRERIKTEVRKRRREFIVDTAFTTSFWVLVAIFKDIVIVQMTLWQVFVAVVSGMLLNLLLGGVYGQCLNWIRRKTRCEMK